MTRSLVRMRARRRFFVRATCAIALLVMVPPAFGRIAGLDSIGFLGLAWLATYWPAVAAAAVLIRERGVMPPSAWYLVGAATGVASALLFFVIPGMFAIFRLPLVVAAVLFVAMSIGFFSAPLLRWWILQREVD